MEISSAQFATFWQRFAARIIDGIVLSVLSIAFYYMAGFDGPLPYGVEENVFKNTGVFVVVSDLLLFYIFYYPFFEANGGTIGKKVLSITPISIGNMETISILQAYKRSFAQIWPLFVLVALMFVSSYMDKYLERTSNFLIAMLIVFIVVGPLAMILSVRKQAWHDAWTGTIVVQSGKSRKRRDLEELVEE